MQVLTQYANGARGIYHFSGTTLLGPGKQIHLFGSLGTIKIQFGEHDRVFLGRKVDSEPREITIPPEKMGGWRVEAEFVAAIRGEDSVRRTSFPEGLRYMAFTEAVSRSAQTGQVVSIAIT
jgi:predicted dehydrogenase